MERHRRAEVLRNRPQAQGGLEFVRDLPHGDRRAGQPGEGLGVMGNDWTAWTASNHRLACTEAVYFEVH